MKLQRKHAALASDFIKSILDLAANEENLDNLESYLSIHFDVWFDKFANTPEGLVDEMKRFASM